LFGQRRGGKCGTDAGGGGFECAGKVGGALAFEGFSASRHADVAFGTRPRLEANKLMSGFLKLGADSM
jgi:hypothetical protein